MKTWISLTFTVIFLLANVVGMGPVLVAIPTVSFLSGHLMSVSLVLMPASCWSGHDR